MTNVVHNWRGRQCKLKKGTVDKEAARDPRYRVLQLNVNVLSRQLRGKPTQIDGETQHEVRALASGMASHSQVGGRDPQAAA